MKNKSLLLLVLFAIPVAALRWGSHPRGGQATSGVAYFIAPAENDLSDLDVRDAENQPIRTAAATQNLEDLFRENLTLLTVFATPHAVAQTVDWLNQFSNLFNKHFYTRVLILFSLFQDLILPPQRRFVHNVHNMWITLFVGQAVSGQQHAVSGIPLTAYRLPLRC